jgi:hypothetical protein
MVGQCRLTINRSVHSHTTIVTLLAMQVHPAHFSFNQLTHTHKAIHAMIIWGFLSLKRLVLALLSTFAREVTPSFLAKRCCYIMVDPSTSATWNGASHSGVLLNRARRFMLPLFNVRKLNNSVFMWLCFYKHTVQKDIIVDELSQNRTNLCLHVKKYNFKSDP